MIAYLKGRITYKSPTFIYLDVGGVGYHVNISLHTYTRIEKEEEVKLLTHLHIKEDSHTIFGFFDAEERTLFVHLLSVSGIGPNTAKVIISSMTPEEARQAILAEDELTFKQVKGIGSKTAKQIILDLKNKISRSSDGDMVVAIKDNTLHEETLSALLALGFNKSKVTKVIFEVSKTESNLESVEALVKASLKQLSS